MDGKKEFIVVALDLNDEIFIIHVAFLISFDLDLDIYFFRKAPKAFLKADKAFTSLFSEYANFADVISKNLAAKLPEHIRINHHIINVVSA